MRVGSQESNDVVSGFNVSGYMNDMHAIKAVLILKIFF